MDNITHVLHQAMALLIFCIAVTLLLMGYQNYCHILIEVSKVNHNEIIYETPYEVIGRRVTKGEMIASLCNSLEYDVVIDGYFINHYSHNKADILTYPLNSNEYKINHEYDTKGNIIKIIYTSIETSNKS